MHTPPAPIIPEHLTTRRLVLRRPEVQDLEPYIGFFATDRSAMSMGPMNRADAFREFCLELGLWQIKGFGNYTILRNGEPIGLTGLWHPEYFDEPEIGWLLREGHEGKGYATEAASAVRDMAERLGWEPPVSYIDVKNRRSKALAKRLGAHFERIHPKWADTEIWRHRSRPA